MTGWAERDTKLRGKGGRGRREGMSHDRLG